jgi:hypothetical protein
MAEGRSDRFWSTFPTNDSTVSSKQFWRFSALSRDDWCPAGKRFEND